MSRRKPGGPVGRHAGERLLSTLGSGLEDPAVPSGPPADPVFVYGDSSTQPAVAPSSSRTLAFRYRSSLRAALLIAVLCVVGAGCFWWQALAGRTGIEAVTGIAPGSGEKVHSPEELPPVAPTSSAIGIPQPGSAGTAGVQPGAVVHVAGAVNTPGVVTLPPGSRINDAIAAAGGPAAVSDPGVLNLAALVTDGQRIFVPRPGEELPQNQDGVPAAGASAPAPGGEAAGGAAPKVNINTATPAELATLPKVGPVLAQNIVDWRQEHGPFAAVEELDAVDGIGPKMLEALLPLVTL